MKNIRKNKIVFCMAYELYIIDINPKYLRFKYLYPTCFY